MEKEYLKVTKSQGRAKNGNVYFYVRPLLSCSNKSRRVHSDLLHNWILKFMPSITYYVFQNNSGWKTIIGAKDQTQAWKEYKRICEKRENLSNTKVAIAEGYNAKTLTERNQYLDGIDLNQSFDSKQAQIYRDADVKRCQPIFYKTHTRV